MDDGSLAAVLEQLTNRALLRKLWNILQNVDYQNMVRWSDDGKSFEIVDLEGFVRDVLPRHFKASKNPWGSFQRNLTGYYSFKRVDGQPLQFYHPLFLLHDPASMLQMKRNPNTGNVKKTQNRALRRAALQRQGIKQRAVGVNKCEAAGDIGVRKQPEYRNVSKEGILRKRRTRPTQMLGIDNIGITRPQLLKGCLSSLSESHTSPSAMRPVLRPTLRPPQMEPAVAQSTIVLDPFSAAQLTPRLLGTTGSTPRQLLEIALSSLISPQPQNDRDLQAQSDEAFEEYMNVVDFIEPLYSSNGQQQLVF